MRGNSPVPDRENMRETREEGDPSLSGGDEHCPGDWQMRSSRSSIEAPAVAARHAIRGLPARRIQEPVRHAPEGSELQS